MIGLYTYAYINMQMYIQESVIQAYSILKIHTGISNNKSIKQGLDRLVKVGLIEVVKKGYYDKDKKVSMSNRYRVSYPYPESFVIKNIK